MYRNAIIGRLTLMFFNLGQLIVAGLYTVKYTCEYRRVSIISGSIKYSLSLDVNETDTISDFRILKVPLMIIDYI